MPQLPDPLPIEPRGPIDGHVRPPGSKSLTNRALLVAALAKGESRLAGPLESDDTVAMREGLAQLGCPVDASGDPWIVPGRSGALDAPGETLHCKNSGTTARFLTAAACLAKGPVMIDGDPRMRERPIRDLVAALSDLGAKLSTRGENGCPPVEVAGGGLPGGPAEIDAARSSQYVSAVLLAAPYADRDVELRLKDGVLISRPYVDLTLQVMRAFGAEAAWTEDGLLRVRAGAGYTGREYAIEPDASAAAYPFCAAAITRGRVCIEGFAPDSIQADLALLPILEEMGCRVERGDRTITLSGPDGPLRSIDVDLNDLPDASLALAVVCLFADGPSHLRNIESLRIKETDRLEALETELSRLGARAHASSDALRIEPGPLRGASIRTYDDHRMAMALSLAGLRVPGVSIQDPGCVSKTWPDYFSVFEDL